MTRELPATPRFAGDVLTIGFATTAAMWAVGFVLRLPLIQAPGPLIFAALLLVLLLGGAAAGRWGARGVKTGLPAGLLAGVLNLLVLGGALGERIRDNPSSALLWVPGFVLAVAAIMTLGAWAGRALGGRRSLDVERWPMTMSLTAAGTTLLLLAVGGLVTGFEAGLAVPDWPNTYGHNMFLYPLSRMTGGIYFEHSHRLFGTLVGLATITLAVYAHRIGADRAARRTALAAVAMVIVQGLLGGLRVTGRLTLSSDPDVMRPSLTLAIVHGVFGQVFFSTLALVAVMLAPRWRQADAPQPSPEARRDLRLGVFTLAALLVQLVLGALVRHTSSWSDWRVLLHIAMAVVVLSLLTTCAARCWGLYGRIAPLRGLGIGLLILVGLQALLGIAALVAVMLDADATQPSPWQALITTAHQSVGALLLATTAATYLWQRRLLVPAAHGQRQPDAVPLDLA